MVNERESMIFGSIFYNKSGNIDDFLKTSPMQKSLHGGGFINDKNYFFVVTLFEADQAP